MNTHIYSPSSTRKQRPEPYMYTSNNVGLRLATKLRTRPINLTLAPEDMPARPPNSQRSPHKPPHPVLRWYGRGSDEPTMPSSPESRPLSRSASPLQNLLDALTSPLPTPSTSTLQVPPRAVPPSTSLSGSPPFLRSFTRVTLPVASLSNPTPAARPFDPPDDPQTPGAPIFLHHSHLERSSLDSLRSLHDRSSGSSARLANPTSRLGFPSTSTPRFLFGTASAPPWRSFQTDSKEVNDRLLSEEDRAPTVEEEQRNIRKKCA
jgi:triacylglycerol lipase